MLFRKDTFIGNDIKPMFVKQLSDPAPLFIKPEIVEVPTPFEAPVQAPLVMPIRKRPLGIKPKPIAVDVSTPFELPTQAPIITPTPLGVKPLFVKPIPVEVSTPEPVIFQNPQDVIDQAIVQEILPVESEPIHIPSTFEIQQTTEQISEQATLFIEPVKTKIIENETENEDINMVNDCTKHYIGGNSYFDTTPDPITKKQVPPKEPILPFEHKPFGLMRIIVSILIVYIIFFKK